ncbi:integrator complex subunit 12-like [Condylostylus longicornis]|uniref:integrator complex subunit 12-like n=1 Tax=Condylostylus longicornis TaxID=2530218 RepID=UPI00244DE7A1|nr:integrator complex subunit 12-like [Condylostylus longicornis]
MAEVDPIIKMSLKLLHSNAPDSAEKLRITLDEIIKQRFGYSKTLINTLNKKFLTEETTFPRTIKQTEKVDSPGIPEETISIHSEEENLTEFGDLVCVLCGAMVLTAGNRLVECNTCQKLYHQECHKPNITDADANDEDWCCSSCNKIVPVETNFPISTPSSSASSSPYHRTQDSSPTHSKSSKGKSSKDVSSTASRSKNSSSPSFTSNSEKTHKKRSKNKK